MSFVYNKNACKVIMDFFAGKIRDTQQEIDVVSKEKGLETDPAVVKALGDYIRQKERDIVGFNKKIDEMDSHLNSNT